jgi:hypothetical protein
MARSIETQLAKLRRRLRGLGLVWGGARWLALVAAGLAPACAIDWLVDLRLDTPRGLRVTITALQGIVGLVAGYVLLVRPLRRVFSDDALALWVEDRCPRFQQRLISALQLSRPTARIAGMSRELIGALTSQARELAATVDFAALVDRRPLRRGILLTLIVTALAGLVYAAAPATMRALVARQLLFDREIPRAIQLASDSPLVWPSGEAVELKYRASGRGLSAALTGHVVIERDGQAALRMPLTFVEALPDNSATYAVRLPPESVGFMHRACLGDGRSRELASLKYVPRPVVAHLLATVELPEYCGLRPDGRRYEQLQLQGDCLGLANSAVRVVAQLQQPIARAELELLKLSATPGVPDTVVQNLDMVVDTDGRQATARFELRPDTDAYRVTVIDRHGFRNLTPPRRTLTIVADDPPTVSLLPEQFPEEHGLAGDEDADVEGLPVSLGGSIRVAYACQDSYGLGHARFVYRVNEGSWHYLPLAAARPSEAAGAFDRRHGAFENSRFRDQVEFFPIPSGDPDRQLSGVEGGGRFDFLTRAVSGLQAGDQIEYFVEVFDRNPEPGREPGRSEARVKTVVTSAQFVDWVLQTLQQESQIRTLESSQREIFERPETGSREPPS